MNGRVVPAAAGTVVAVLVLGTGALLLAKTPPSRNLSGATGFRTPMATASAPDLPSPPPWPLESMAGIVPVSRVRGASCASSPFVLPPAPPQEERASNFHSAQELADLAVGIVVARAVAPQRSWWQKLDQTSQSFDPYVDSTPVTATNYLVLKPLKGAFGTYVQGTEDEPPAATSAIACPGMLQAHPGFHVAEPGTTYVLFLTAVPPGVAIPLNDVWRYPVRGGRVYSTTQSLLVLPSGGVALEVFEAQLGVSG